MDISVYPGLRRLVALPMFLISLAFLFGALGMTYPAVLQHYIYIANPCNPFISCGDLFSVFAWIQFPQLNSISDLFTNITELEYGCNKVPKWMNSVVMNIVSFMTVIGNVISAAVASLTEDQQLEGNYTRIAITTFLAGVAFYVGFWRRGRYGEEEDATGKGRRMESNMTPVVDSGVRKFLGLIYSYNTKELFEKGFRKYPNSAFCAYVFPFGKVTVLTNRGLIDEMNHAPPDHLSFDEVSRMLIQPDHTTFGRAPQHHPIAVIQQNFNRRLDSLLPGMFDDIKTAVDAALDHTAGGCAVTGLFSHQS